MQYTSKQCAHLQANHFLQMLREGERNYLCCCRLQCSKDSCFFLFHQPLQDTDRLHKTGMSGTCLHAPLERAKQQKKNTSTNISPWACYKCKYFGTTKSQEKSTTSKAGSKDFRYDSKWHLNHHHLPFKKHNLPEPLTLRGGSHPTPSETAAPIPSRITEKTGTYQVTVSFSAL